MFWLLRKPARTLAFVAFITVCLLFIAIGGLFWYPLWISTDIAQASTWRTIWKDVKDVWETGEYTN